MTPLWSATILGLVSPPDKRKLSPKAIIATPYNWVQSPCISL